MAGEDVRAMTLPKALLFSQDSTPLRLAFPAPPTPVHPPLSQSYQGARSTKVLRFGGLFSSSSYTLTETEIDNLIKADVAVTLG